MDSSTENECKKLETFVGGPEVWGKIGRRKEEEFRK